MRFFFHITLQHDTVAFTIPGPQQRSKQPEILSREEVQRLLAAAREGRRRGLLMTIYAAGLRVGEAVHLKSPISTRPGRRSGLSKVQPVIANEQRIA